jgi:hypothetical protein
MIFPLIALSVAAGTRIRPRYVLMTGQAFSSRAIGGMQ